MKRPIKKHPITLTAKVPTGYSKRMYFEVTSFKKNLQIAPKAPPTPINKIAINYFYINLSI